MGSWWSSCCAATGAAGAAGGAAEEVPLLHTAAHNHILARTDQTPLSPHHSGAAILAAVDGWLEEARAADAGHHRRLGELRRQLEVELAKLRTAGGA